MTTEFSSRSRSRSWRWLWALLGVALTFVAATQVYRLFLQAQVRRELNAFRQEEIPTNLRELEDRQAAVPDQENAAVRILEAADYLALAPAPDALCDDRWPGRTAELGPEERDELHDFLTDNAPALEAVHVAARLEKSRFPIDYVRGPGAHLPHLAQVRSLVRLLKAEAIIHSEEGRAEAAVQSVIDSVALARSLDKEPLLISQLVRMACLSASCNTLERLLTQHALSDAQLQALAARFRGAGETSRRAFQSGFAGELCLGVYCFQAPTGEFLGQFGPDAEASLLARYLFPLYTWSGLRDRDFLFFVRMHREMHAAANEPFPAELRAAREITQRVERETVATRLLIVSKMFLPSVHRSVVKAAEADALLRCAEAALNLERSRLQNKGLTPDRLAGTLADIPLDPFDGEPLRYRKLAPGYVIYSVGSDLNDESGTERAGKSSSGARIWPPSGSKLAETTGYDIAFTVER